eukprot:9676090-Lingulodinium_polyedra.AAC.1
MPRLEAGTEQLADLVLAEGWLQVLWLGDRLARHAHVRHDQHMRPSPVVPKDLAHRCLPDRHSKRGLGRPALHHQADSAGHQLLGVIPKVLDALLVCQGHGRSELTHVGVHRRRLVGRA